MDGDRRAHPGSGSSGPERRAAALRHEPGGEGAPVVAAAGRGHLAELILEGARERGVPVREDADLVELLAACELGEEIPVEVWGAVAELLAWLYRVDRMLLEEEAARPTRAGSRRAEGARDD